MHINYSILFNVVLILFPRFLSNRYIKRNIVHNVSYLRNPDTVLMNNGLIIWNLLVFSSFSPLWCPHLR